MSKLYQVPDIWLLFVVTILLLAVHVAFRLQGVDDELVKTLLNGSVFALIAVCTGRRGPRATDIHAGDDVTINANVGAEKKTEPPDTLGNIFNK